MSGALAAAISALYKPAAGGSDPVTNISNKLTADNFATSVTFNAAALGFTMTPGRDMVIEIVEYGPAGNLVTSVVVGGTTQSTVAKRQTAPSGVNDNHASIWHVQNFGSTNTNIVINMTGSGNYITAKAYELAAGSLNGVDQTGGANGVGTTQSASLTADTTQARTFLCACAVQADGTTTTWGYPAGFTGTWNENDPTNHEPGAGGYKVESTTGPKSAAFTSAAQSISYGVAIVAFKLN